MRQSEIQLTPAAPSKAMTCAETAAWLGIHQTTLARWRASGTGPSFVRIGSGRCRYYESDLAAWIESQRAPRAA